MWIDLREELRKARLSRGLRQEDVAKKLGMSTRMYQHLEAGSRDGKVKHWDALEDLFGIPQRTLRS
ncbi:helix-turn-helix domain-containing protein [uncultured Pyramidobacter sp.]|uniref:helix-turn-helix domain-containing protein n=1 Tax=Pyramidobacter piscolens TaxID=638849 RepID=UPI00058B93E5|nr:helix-turn-helix transcriptional regulator [uncultured Pyramidobacter sp.]